VAAGQEETPETVLPPKRVLLVHSLALIAIALLIGAFLIWSVTLSWALIAVAGLVEFGTLALGIWIGTLAYKMFDERVPHWARLTIAIILGFSITMTVFELTHSHRLIRSYEFWHSNDDD